MRSGGTFGLKMFPRGSWISFRWDPELLCFLWISMEALMGEVDKRTESDGKGVFIIRNGQKIANYETGKWMPLLPGVVVRNTPDGIKIEMPD